MMLPCDVHPFDQFLVKTKIRLSVRLPENEIILPVFWKILLLLGIINILALSYPLMIDNPYIIRFKYSIFIIIWIMADVGQS